MRKVNYYEVRVTETGRGSLKEEATIFHQFTKACATLDDIKDYLTEQYGKLPGMRNKIYVDDKDGSTHEIGFTHSFWNSDISHNSKAWYQTDWVEIVSLNEMPVLLTA